MIWQAILNSKDNHKFYEERKFWKQELRRYVDWHNGANSHFGIEPPKEKERIVSFDTIEKNAAMTWSKLYQEKRYLADLGLSSTSLSNKRVLDIGCGPLPSALCYKNAVVYGLDHLVDQYRSLGFPIDEASDRFFFVQAKSERIPFEDGIFDAVISANAIDHVDDFAKTAQEIQRVLKKGGKFRMHVHYHKPTATEPIELNDKIFLKHYSWVKGLKKISTSKTKDLGFTKANPGESYVIWGN